MITLLANSSLLSLFRLGIILSHFPHTNDLSRVLIVYSPFVIWTGGTDSIQFRSSWKKYSFLKYFIGLLALSSSDHKLMKHQLMYPYLHQRFSHTHTSQK